MDTEQTQPPSEDLPPKPDPEPVEEVKDEELDELQEKGEDDVDFLPPKEADADETIDTGEQDVPPPAQPTQGQGADPAGGVPPGTQV